MTDMQQHSELITFGRAAHAVAWRHFRKWISIPANLMPTLMFPLLFFTAFAGGLASVENIRGFDYPASYTTFQYAFVLLQMAAFGGVATGFSIAGDFATGFYQRLFVATARREAIMLGFVLSTFLRYIILLLVVTGIALVADLELPAGIVGWVGAVSLGLVLNVAGTMWACAVMFRGRGPHFAPLMQVPVFILLFLAPVYMPIELLDGWIEFAARANPLTYLLAGTRGSLVGLDADLAMAWGCAGALLVVTTLLALGGLRRAERASG